MAAKRQPTALEFVLGVTIIALLVVCIAGSCGGVLYMLAWVVGAGLRAGWGV